MYSPLIGYPNAHGGRIWDGAYVPLDLRLGGRECLDYVLQYEQGAYIEGHKPEHAARLSRVKMKRHETGA